MDRSKVYSVPNMVFIKICITNMLKWDLKEMWTENVSKCMIEL